MVSIPLHDQIDPPLAGTGRDRAALLLVQIALVGVIVAALPFKAFELDRFFVPKELVLHACAIGAALLVLGRRRQVTVAVVDWLLVGFLVLSAVSALFAINRWAAGRAFAMSYSGALLFWTSATLSRRGYGRRLVATAVVGVVVGAVTALIQAYLGDATELFSINRAPGGTFGNRNFMAHLCAIGVPTLVVAAITSAKRRWFLLSLLGMTIVTGALVLSRSRAAYLALASAIVAVAVVALVVRAAIDRRRAVRRSVALAAFTATGAAAAAFLPNRLEWRSASPYLDTVRGVVNYREGSGAGRLVQYSNSLEMARANPLLGVGPGNWAVGYPKYASRNDPSLSAADGMTANPWPSSDWVAFVSERGVLASLCLVLAFLGLVVRALRSARLSTTAASDDGARALMLTGTLAATAVVGMFDAVLLLAVPTTYVWVLVGALAPSARVARPWGGVRGLVPLMLGLGLIGVARSAMQLISMAQYNQSTSRASLSLAAKFDPGNYRVRMRAASAFLAQGDCRRAAAHARAARRLFPNAGEPRRVLRSCGVRD